MEEMVLAAPMIDDAINGLHIIIVYNFVVD